MEKIGLNINCSKSFMPILKKVAFGFLGGTVICGSGYGAYNDVNNELSAMNDRITKIEQVANDVNIELDGQRIELDNYTATIKEIKDDQDETQRDIKQILVILTRKR